MKIAFITYEYPPDTAFGGIATYVHQAAKMMHQRGHYVEVISGSHNRSCTDNIDGFLVHRIKETNLWDFYKPAGLIFEQRNAEIQFDVLEGPEFAADAREAVRLVPDIPLIVKLHTPSIILFDLNYPNPHSKSFSRNVHYLFKSVLEGIKPQWGYDPAFLKYRNETLRMNEIERLHTLDADEISSPSSDLGKILSDKWRLNPDIISTVPYPYQPSEKLLKIPVETSTNVITFLGRLEIRKGVLDLAKAIPLVLQQYPDVRFRFVGPSDISPDPNINMDIFLKQKLDYYKNSVDFTGAVPLDFLPNILCATDICVFPSLWENFPLVCLESMAAGRGIIATNNGGMKDMLTEGETGRLISPNSPGEIARIIIDLLKNKKHRMVLGQAARNHLINEYNTNRIGALQEKSYHRAIQHRQANGIRFIN